MNLKQIWDYSGCYEKSQTHFFTDMIKIQKIFNLVKALGTKEILPSKKRYYVFDGFKDALKGMIEGVRPRIYCRQHPKKANEANATNMLDAIELYLDQQLNTTKDSKTNDNSFECMPNIGYYPTEC